MKQSLVIFLLSLIIIINTSCSNNNSQVGEKTTSDSINIELKLKNDSNSLVKYKLDSTNQTIRKDSNVSDSKEKIGKTIDGIKITKILSEGISEGIFKEIEIGDYGHFNITNPKGELESFFIIYKEDNIEDGFAYGKYYGRKVKVTWQKVEAIIKQSGDNNRIIEVISKAELLK